MTARTVPRGDEAAIKSDCADLIVRYAYLNDERRFDELAALFTEDAVLFRPSAPEQPVAGRQAILAALCKRPPETATFHVTSDVQVEVDSATTARCRSRILMMSGTRSPEGGAPTDVRAPVPGVFVDVLRLTVDGWRFVSRRGSLWLPA
jgi:ketosteroid isomerase-like protein